MSFRCYGKYGTLQISPTLRAMLTETGEHVFRLAFGTEAETKRNFIFGVIVTQAVVSPELCAWDVIQETGRCVHICYELCDAFPLHENGESFCQLQEAIERILSVRVRLLPFTYFQRSIGMYPSLREIFRSDSHESCEFAGIFRDDAGSLLDQKMHIVLSRWERAPFLSPPEPPVSPGSAARALQIIADCIHPSIPRDEWNTCFQSIASVYWYHAYVCELIDEDIRDGCSESNAMRTYDAVTAKGGKDVSGKLALLDILKLVYRYNYSVA